MAINSRQKGARAERMLRDELREAGYCKTYRTQQFCGSTVSADVTCPELPDIHWECKAVEAGNPYVWLDQAIRDSKRIRFPVVAHKRNGRKWIVILELRDFLEIIRRSDLPRVSAKDFYAPCDTLDALGIPHDGKGKIPIPVKQ